MAWGKKLVVMIPIPIPIASKKLEVSEFGVAGRVCFCLFYGPHLGFCFTDHICALVWRTLFVLPFYLPFHLCFCFTAYMASAGTTSYNVFHFAGVFYGDKKIDFWGHYPTLLLSHMVQNSFFVASAGKSRHDIATKKSHKFIKTIS